MLLHNNRKKKPNFILFRRFYTTTMYCIDVCVFYFLVHMYIYYVLLSI